MNATIGIRIGAATVTVLTGCGQLIPVTAVAGTELHNVTYQARIDGVNSGAVIAYQINDDHTNSASPMMLTGRVFEADTVLADPKKAGMRVSIQWPYSANLHCEIDVDDTVVAQADEFIPAQLTPVNDDPEYGVLQCGAPLSDADGGSVPAA